MELTFECPKCKMIDHVDDVESASQARCSHCQTVRDLHPEAIADGGTLAACPLCGTPDVYIQKDFPQTLGLAIVCVGFAVSTVFWYYENPIPAYLVLLASALLDMILYYRVPNVAICYRCQSQFRGPGSNPDGRFGPFDLSVGERYRQERLRIEELRQRGDSVKSPPSEPTARDDR
ncbi:MAG: hypothetical protein P4L85_20655 [Paludisphaera borealis]|uniref:hypothetical protein n=1 Tax=Paludisphaera borealis TaxID=1387353 RepID=UPI00284758BA|nr:hypothetical protein [Paludisphaera borealis]MDR3621776.1 hypothetical protein [Paludisphaera borealis]